MATEPLHFPNGAVITGHTLIVTETFGHRISAFDIDADGGLSERRDWATFGPVPATTDVGEALGQLSVAPDGMCLDAEGAVWIADALGNRALRVREGGEVLQEISTGDTGVYALALGGADGRTLFLCTAPGSPSTSAGTPARRSCWPPGWTSRAPEPARPTRSAPCGQEYADS